MYKKMLVLLDGSKLAEVVFRYAQEVSGRLNVDLELLHVCSPQEAEQLPMRQAYVEHMAETLRKKAEEIRASTGGGGRNIHARGAVAVGYPAEEILKYADENNIDLIMLSTHGRSGIRLWGLGAVASKVIHASKVPVWVVPSELREEVILDRVPHRTMVIPLSGSRLSEGILPHAISLAKQRGAESELVLVYVEPLVTASRSLSDIKRLEEERAEMQKYLDGVAARVREAGLQVQTRLLLGDPAEAILEYVRENPAQLIAMATHGHVGLSRMIFGSTTENLLNLVKKTPLFLVRPPEE